MNPTPLNRMIYSLARHDARIQLRRAKSDWILSKCSEVNDGFYKSSCIKSPWDSIKLLKSGLTPHRRAPCSPCSVLLIAVLILNLG